MSFWGLKNLTVWGIPGIWALEWAGGVIWAPGVPSEAPRDHWAPGQHRPLPGHGGASVHSRPRMLREAVTNKGFPSESN